MYFMEGLIERCFVIGMLIIFLALVLAIVVSPESKQNEKEIITEECEMRGRFNSAVKKDSNSSISNSQRMRNLSEQANSNKAKKYRKDYESLLTKIENRAKLGYTSYRFSGTLGPFALEWLIQDGFKLECDDGSPEEGNRGGIPSTTISW